jgi:ornithine carbamoyltransferase
MMIMTIKTHSVLSDNDLTAEQTLQVLNTAILMKQNPQDFSEQLKGKSVATLFEKPSLRTRVSLDVGINKLGGHAVYLDQQNGAMGKREEVKDFANNLSCWVDAIVARVMEHDTLIQLKEHANVPVINSLCDKYHPCQALADFMSLKELYGKLNGLTLAYVGDGNNVAHSLLLTAAKLGVNMVIITPEGHEVDNDILEQGHAIASSNGCYIKTSYNLNHLDNVDVVYGDTWISMGDNSDENEVKAIFSPYQISLPLLEEYQVKHYFHCQPAHREQEVTSEVLESSKSELMRQAENRMWAQNALLDALINEKF